ncbi:hypothetical protein Mgra_00000464 [Meloidogyne graminicola]|uniref:Uncharacterized protein n=1 Tax=Meloidogyne graminicola TaxID=189291 RepID=A0A8T0A3Y1_9BILA|nr:hypothetical protein Mgra_00000464 [Meloidogyne graminicola]
MNEIRQTKLKSCNPNIIIKNYANAVENANYTMQSCILPCDRWEYTVSMEKIDTLLIYGNTTLIPFIYRIDISYNDLQFELIEEVATVSFMGLIAQIGGQMSLFMGSSILTLTQAIIICLKDKKRNNLIRDVNINNNSFNNKKKLAKINEKIVNSDKISLKNVENY